MCRLGFSLRIGVVRLSFELNNHALASVPGAWPTSRTTPQYSSQYSPDVQGVLTDCLSRGFKLHEHRTSLTWPVVVLYNCGTVKPLSGADGAWWLAGQRLQVGQAYRNGSVSAAAGRPVHRHWRPFVSRLSSPSWCSRQPSLRQQGRADCRAWRKCRSASRRLATGNEHTPST